MKNKSLNIIVLAILSLFVLGNVNGQTLSDYLTVAAENNPGLKAKFNEYLAALEKPPQAGALPDPQLSFSFFVRPMERYMGNQVAEISLMQMFPWFGTLAAAKNEAALIAKAKYEAFNEAKSTLFYEVKATWYAMYLLEEEIAITEENIQILTTLEQLAISRFKSGSTGEGKASSAKSGMPDDEQRGSSATTGGMGGMNMPVRNTSGNTPDSPSMTKMGPMNEMSAGGSMVDVLRVQMEINELKNRLAWLKDSKPPFVAQFNKLLNRPSGATVILPDSITTAALPVAIAQIPDNIRRNNPMLKMLEKEEQAFQAQERMNRKMGFPMIGLGLQYNIFKPRPDGQSMMNGQDMVMPMATVSIPLWRKKYNASVREAGLLREAASEKRQDANNQLMMSYEEALKDFNDAKRRVELYQQQMTLAQQAWDILTAQYSSAGGDFEEVLRMQQQLLDYRLKGLDATVDGNIAVAMLERLMGR